MVEFKEVEAKTVLNKYRYRDNWFWCMYSVNPYRGCQFACNYCDAITEKYLVHENVEDFSRIIYVKTNAPELLEKELKKAKKDVVALSGVTDPYQPAERKYEITRRILEILRDENFPVHIGTKSDLVLRDADILSEISKKSWCTVSFTVTTFDKKLLLLLEPFSPPPERRIEAMKKLAEAGIRAGVDFTPIIPFILDDDNNIQEVVRKASENNAEYILPGSGMTLRSNQRIRWFDLLKENWPGLVEKYEKLYGESQEPDREYVVKINRKAFEICKEFNIKTYIQPPDFERPLKENFEVANLLLLVAYFKERRTGNPYAAWAYHKAAQNIEGLKESIRDICNKSKLEEIPGVGENLAEVIREFLDAGKCEKLERLKTEW
jgi:DNA repair photolyase